MNKATLLQFIRNDLQIQRTLALSAAADAHQIATHKENIAENKYDTLGLEAAYLAHGQSQRVLQIDRAIAAYNLLTPTDFNENTPIAFGALIQLTDKQTNTTNIFLGPSSGGATINYEGLSITLITPEAPLGKALHGCYVGERISLNIAGRENNYTITDLI